MFIHQQKKQFKYEQYEQLNKNVTKVQKAKLFLYVKTRPFSLIINGNLHVCSQKCFDFFFFFFFLDFFLVFFFFFFFSYFFYLFIFFFQYSLFFLFVFLRFVFFFKKISSRNYTYINVKYIYSKLPYCTLLYCFDD